MADTQETLRKVEKAIQYVYDLCHGRRHWTMSVPVRPDKDSDVMIIDALQAAKKALAAIPAHAAQRPDRVAVSANADHAPDRFKEQPQQVAELEKQSQRLQEICATAYQMAGMLPDALSEFNPIDIYNAPAKEPRLCLDHRNRRLDGEKT